MPTDTPFSLNSVVLPCPEFKIEPGDFEYFYQDGSPVYFGMPKVNYSWPNLTAENVVIVRSLFDDLITDYDPSEASSGPQAVTAPDYLNGGFRATTGYLREPGGAAGGDLSKNFNVTVCNLHEQSFLDAMAAPENNFCELMATGPNIKYGPAQYLNTGWQF